ncbi:ABC transporter permease [Nanchangia anserum]|uniref:Transport permease protein n=1 Tax=Nanchangia anserum TaxID=2692125 RepID=A0A8I0KTZ7_9ACTO|nr:ABC transporter permease [Nanchangia anserum]MBD3689153.1 ABC transporter permease [Nanchangia anserum]QOX81385.1 ABC transporter permease [Nanchangia anserum]
MNWWSSFRALCRLEICGADLNTWRRWLSFCISPAAYFCLLGLGLSGILGGEDYLEFVGPGIVVMQALSALSQIIYRVVIERRWGLAAMKLQAGVPMSAYLASLLVPRIIIFLLQGFVVLVCMLAFGVRVSPLPALLGLLGSVVCVVFWSFLGVIVTSVVSNYQTRDFIVSIIVLPLTFSAPVFYRLEGAPTLVRVLARVNPLSYQVQWVRGLFNSKFVLVDFAVVIILVVVCCGFALRAVNGLRIASFEG